MAVQVKPLLSLTPIEVLPKFIKNLEDAAKFVKKLKETDPDIVSSAVNRSGSEDDHRMLHGGLIYLALTEPETRRTCLHDILLTSRDNLNYALSELTRLVAEAWPKMLQPVRKSMLAILAELIATRGANVDILVLHVFRRMPSGDLSSLNLWLIQSVLDLLIRNREWLEHEDRKPFLLPLAVYTFLRLIPDHLNGSPSSSSKGFDPAVSSTIATLFQRESNFVVETLRKDFDRCASIGRDLIRLLHPLSRTEPFQRLWNDIFNNISSLSNIHTSVNSVLDIATPQYFAQTLIPQDMEVWIRWMLRNVHCASGFPVRRYQEFFHKKFFSTQESLNLRVCLVRYIVNSFYPDNDMLASSLIPRWNVISWLISQCTCQTTCQSMKLALFFDWFFFKPNECIMNVEPAILAIANNLSSRFQPFGLVLVEYLTKTAANFCPALTERIAMSVRSGLEDMLRLGVIRSISPFLDILLRASPEIYRNFSSLIGPLVDSTLPIPSAIGPGCGSASTPIPVANEVGGGSGGGSTDDALAHSSALNLSAVNPSATGPPTDPRLRRHTLTSSTPKNGGPHSPPVLPPKPRPRSPSPDGCGRFSPPPIPYVDLSSSGVLSSADTKSQTPSTKPQKQSESKLQSSPLPSAVSPSVTPIREKLSALPNNFESFASPEYRIGPNSSGDSVQQRIDDLRRKFQFYQLRYLYKMKTDVDVNGLIGQFDGQIREDLENLASAAKAAGIFREAEAVIEETPASTPNSSSTDDAALTDMCEAMQGLIDSVLDDDFPDDLAVAGRIADIVCQLCLPLFDAAGGDWGSNGVANHRALATLLPSHLPITQEQIDASLASPVFVPLRNLCEMSRGNNKREILLLLLTEIQIRQPRIGYHLLYFLAVSTVNDEKMMAYRSFCASQENPNVVACLQRDMQLLADDNRFLFCYLLPTVWSVFSNDLANNTDFIRLIVGKIDPSQANYLVCEILRGHLNFFHRPNITDVLKASLDWTSMEQFFFWQLVNAHELPTKTFLPLISLVDGQKHPEACSHLLLLLQLEKPTNEVVRLLLSRGISNLNSTATSSTTDDLLSVTALHYWGCPGRLNAQRFAEILGSMINATVSGLRAAHDGEESASAAKKRNGVKSGSGLEHLSLLVSILTHLDCMRRKCRNIASEFSVYDVLFGATNLTVRFCCQ
uniref:Ints3_N domain-containing protein n=1 Tax=Mesocestoides corti TaxID=53468 RepID=A0A5K3EP16_MESCO